MNPSYEQPSLRLPEPLNSSHAEGAVPEGALVANPERVSSGQQPIPVPTPLPSSLHVPPPTDPTIQGPPQAAIQTTTVATPKIADDADLIEKEWVTRARAIVQRTKEDPRLQTSEMNRFKADYLKKRYNKDLKINEG